MMLHPPNRDHESSATKGAHNGFLGHTGISTVHRAGNRQPGSGGVQFAHPDGPELGVADRCPTARRDGFCVFGIRDHGRRGALRGHDHQDHQGTLALQSLVPGTVALRGSHGFRFDGRIQSGLEPSYYCGVFDPCAPGTTAPFTATWVGTDIPGTVRLQGDEFRVGSADASSMYIELTGSFVAPAHLTDTASVTVPFTATGLLSRDYPLPTLQLSGGGAVTFTLQWQSAINGWAIRFTSFDFGGGHATKG